MSHCFFKGSSLKVFFKDALKVSGFFWPFALLPEEALAVWDPLKLLHLWNILSMQWWHFSGTVQWLQDDWAWVNQNKSEECKVLCECGISRELQGRVLLMPKWKQLDRINFVFILHWSDGVPDIHKKIIFFLTVSVSSSLNSSCHCSRELAFITEFTVCLSHSAFQRASEGELRDLWCTHVCLVLEKTMDSLFVSKSFY